MWGGTDSRRVVEVEHQGGEADNPVVHAFGAIETVVGAILVDLRRRTGKTSGLVIFVPVATLFFKTIHAFVIVNHKSRRVVHFGVTDHPTDEWINQQVRDATPFKEKPKYLISENDKKSVRCSSGWLPHAALR